MTPADERRLQRFDAFARGVHDDLAQIERRLRERNETGRTTSSTYQQLLATRAMLQEILKRLEDAGL